ncbi:MAG: hypothetical protein H6939_10970 [Burkholderiales bacterium]|nr:hypothetical protein [Burkholderiales bacterium]
MKFNNHIKMEGLEAYDASRTQRTLRATRQGERQITKTLDIIVDIDKRQSLAMPYFEQ